MDFRPNFGEVSRYEPTFLNVGTFPVRRGTVIIEKGQVLGQGAVLGRKSATQKYVLCAKTGSDGTAIKDGSEMPRRILSMNVDATDEDKKATVYLTGAFLKTGLILGPGHSIESITDDFELRSIYLEDRAT